MSLDTITTYLEHPAPTRRTLAETTARLAALVAAADEVHARTVASAAAERAWRADAACLHHPAEWWLEPVPTPSGGAARWRPEAKEICRGCPVRVECAEAGRHELAGLWGGLTRAERQADTRRRRDSREVPGQGT